MQSIDPAFAVTKPFSPTDVHTSWASLAGGWRGTTQTWLDPKAPPEVAEVRADGAALFGGRFLRLNYASVVMGGPHAGQLLLGYSADESLVTVIWLDSFHCSPGIMTSTGPSPIDGQLIVRGSYAAGPERWGWRTVISQPTPDRILIEMFNVSPAGEEDRGVEFHLERAPAGRA